MNVESLREFCLSLPQVTECFPFDEWVLVSKSKVKCFSSVICRPKRNEFRSNAIPNLP